MFGGAEARKSWWYELALYTAWHTAAFAAQAMTGKLEAWPTYRQRVKPVATATTVPTAPVSWQERKAERQRQMNLHRRHLEQQQRRRRRPHA